MGQMVDSPRSTSLDSLVADIVSVLAPRYDELLARLFSRPVWTDGPIPERRVLWSDAQHHRKSDSFRCRGVYIWGFEDRPLYIGKTHRTYNERFGRYIWQKESQCNLALNHQRAIVERGLGGFPADVLARWQKAKTKRPVRLEGSIRFAQEGIDQIWFALFPVTDARYIQPIESLLIVAANEWNAKRGISPLLNIDGVDD